MILVAIARVHEFLLVESFNVIYTLEHVATSSKKKFKRKMTLCSIYL